MEIARDCSDRDTAILFWRAKIWQRQFFKSQCDVECFVFLKNKTKKLKYTISPPCPRVTKGFQLEVGAREHLFAYFLITNKCYMINNKRNLCLFA